MGWQKGPGSRYAPLTPAVLDPGCEEHSPEIPRTYLHIDMDAFFASVEERDNPDLKGKPVAVGGGPGKRGVVTTANYVARKFGLHSGMSSFEAQKKCPDAVFLPINGSKYIYVSAQIMAALESFSPIVRPLSVDEASLDITGCDRHYGNLAMLGQAIKDKIREKFELPCTVGIGPNRLIAKMAANIGKPDGLLVLDSEGAAKAFAPLPVDKMVGIGKSTSAALEGIGIRTLGDLANCSDYKLKNRFGIIGPNMKKMARGEWAGRMRLDDERAPIEKSIGHSRTFSENISDIVELRCRLVGLSEMGARRVRRAQVVGQVLTLKLRYPDFRTPSHQMRMPSATDDEETLIDYAWKLLSELWNPGAPVRLLGVSLRELAPKKEWSGQLNLFSLRRQRRACDLHEALDTLRDRFGENVVSRAMSGRYKGKPKRGSSGEIIPFGHRLSMSRQPATSDIPN